MKPNKHREHLQNRMIEPSSGSWERLDEKLTAHENQKKARNWMILKIASFILLLVSIGIYYYQPLQNTLPAQEIASPVSKEDRESIPEKDALTEIKISEKSRTHETQIAEKSMVPEIETAENPNVFETKKNTLTDRSKNEFNSGEVAFSPIDNDLNSTVVHDFKVEENEAIPEELSSSEYYSAEDELLDQEIDQLLHQTKLKLIVNGQISSKKYVNTDALLNSVEDDLDKDLRQKLIEKIVNTIKKDKEVVTSEEN
ncbi:MAG: hypothetical protein JSV73_10985 [Flavobacteriaceae bacterium]|nr:MAG: hypothetical protein JSV73_10985 [Flavobacteriaceae bacterium]